MSLECEILLRRSSDYCIDQGTILIRNYIKQYAGNVDSKDSEILPEFQLLKDFFHTLIINPQEGALKITNNISESLVYKTEVICNLMVLLGWQNIENNWTLEKLYLVDICELYDIFRLELKNLGYPIISPPDSVYHLYNSIWTSLKTENFIPGIITKRKKSATKSDDISLRSKIGIEASLILGEDDEEADTAVLISHAIPKERNFQTKIIYESSAKIFTIKIQFYPVNLHIANSIDKLEPIIEMDIKKDTTILELKRCLLKEIVSNLVTPSDLILFMAPPYVELEDEQVITKLGKCIAIHAKWTSNITQPFSNWVVSRLLALMKSDKAGAPDRSDLL